MTGLASQTSARFLATGDPNLSRHARHWIVLSSGNAEGRHNQKLSRDQRGHEAIFLGAHQSPGFMFQGSGYSRQQHLVALRHNEDQFPSTDMLYQKQPANEIGITYQFPGETLELRASPQGIGFHSAGSWPLVIQAFFGKMRLLDVRVLLDRTLEEQAWDQLLNIRGDRDLLKMMNSVYELKLESFSYSARTRALKALFTDRDYALNIDDLGAGMRIALRMFMAILLSDGSRSEERRVGKE